MGKEWIAYVGPFHFPWGQPGSRRVCGVARSLADAGYHVVVASGESGPLVPVTLDEGELQGTITYLGLGELPAPGMFFLKKTFQLFVYWGKRTVNWLEVQSVKPSHVIVYGGSAQYMFHLLPWCHRNRVPLIVDVVEWYDASHMKGGFFGPFHLSAKFALKIQYPKVDGIIAISSYLADYYRKRGRPVVVVPPTIDLEHILDIEQVPRDDTGRLRLVYAGTPGKKDLVVNVIRGISLVDPRGERVSLQVIGPTEQQIRSLLATRELPVFVLASGRVAQTEVARIVNNADFSVLLREPLTFAQAGFPTKFVESLANGTPVMANITSDLGDYLHDGKEGLVCPGFTAEAFAETLKRALALTAEDLQQMRIASRNQAERSFDYRNFIEPLGAFLGEVRR